MMMMMGMHVAFQVALHRIQKVHKTKHMLTTTTKHMYHFIINHMHFNQVQLTIGLKLSFAFKHASNVSLLKDIVGVKQMTHELLQDVSNGVGRYL